MLATLTTIDDAISMAKDGWEASDEVLLKETLKRLLNRVPRDMEFPQDALVEALTWAIAKIATSAKHRPRVFRRRQETT